jgi:GTP-binding protein Era
VDEATLETYKKEALDLFPAKDMIEISTFQKRGLELLLERLQEMLPEGEPFFDEETVTDYYERDIATELIRESAMYYLQDEVPHCLAVRMDEYVEREENKAHIEATIFVERDSQKGIIIGKGGEMLKKIGTRARQEIESMSGRKVYLGLNVKVNKNWRNSPEALHLLGYENMREE